MFGADRIPDLGMTSHDYREARAHAQREANADGFDRGLERLPDFQGGHHYRTFRLPDRRHRQGHETRCEVVSCETLARCQPHHGPEAPAPVSSEERLAIARGLGRLIEARDRFRT